MFCCSRISGWSASALVSRFHCKQRGTVSRQFKQRIESEFSKYQYHEHHPSPGLRQELLQFFCYHNDILQHDLCTAPPDHRNLQSSCALVHLYDAFLWNYRDFSHELLSWWFGNWFDRCGQSCWNNMGLHPGQCLEDRLFVSSMKFYCCSSMFGDAAWSIYLIKCFLDGDMVYILASFICS